MYVPSFEIRLYEEGSGYIAVIDDTEYMGASPDEALGHAVRSIFVEDGAAAVHLKVYLLGESEPRQKESAHVPSNDCPAGDSDDGADGSRLA